MRLISHILTICLPGNISRSGALRHQTLAIRIQNQPGPSNQTPTSPFGSPLTWVTPLRSTSSIEVPVNWGTRPGLEPPQPGHSFSCWSYSVNSSDMAATPDLAQHLRPCAASQALRSQSSLATTSGFAKHSRPCITPQALRAEMANCSGSRSGCSRKRHIPSACCSISPGQGHQAE